MISELEFKQIRRKYQGKYYVSNIADGIIIYRHIIKVMQYNESSEKDENCVMVINKSIIIANNNLIQSEMEFRHILSVSILEKYFYNKISQREYKKVYTKYIQNNTCQNDR